MSYQKLFDPDTSAPAPLEELGKRLGDQAPAPIYVYDDEVILAVNVALATGRPLLISGEPGTGKSSLAAAVAEKLKFRFYVKTISSRTQARDLLWTFEAVRRLSDAHTGGVRSPAAYIEPGVLWWAFDPESARLRGLKPDEWSTDADRNTVRELTYASYPTSNPGAARALVLLDEIDKADPDVPNDLLEPLGSFRFRLLEGHLDRQVTARQAPLVFITTNQERDLPKAFLRRCVSLTLRAPDERRLLDIAAAHFPADVPVGETHASLHREIAKRYYQLRTRANERRVPPPSTAEYLDAVSACRELGLVPETQIWTEYWPKIEEAALGKQRDV